MAGRGLRALLLELPVVVLALMLVLVVVLVLLLVVVVVLLLMTTIHQLTMALCACLHAQEDVRASADVQHRPPVPCVLCRQRTHGAP